MSAHELQEVQDAATKLRAAPSNEALTSGTVAAIARGVVARIRPATLAKNGGIFKLGLSWEKYHLAKEELRPYATTSNRTVPTDKVCRLSKHISKKKISSQILDSALVFYRELNEHILAKNLTFNWDEFCVLLGPNRKWTWHPMRERRTVSICQTKAAFACTVLTGVICFLTGLVVLHFRCRGKLAKIATYLARCIGRCPCKT